MTYRLRKGCPRCARPTPDGKRCARCRGATPAPKRRAYSDTAEYRRVRAEVLETWGPVCGAELGFPYCGQSIDLSPDAADPLVLAHVVAHVDGGEFTPENIRPAHRSCNAAAGATTLGGI